jgi:hypothetical protein
VCVCTCSLKKGMNALCTVLRRWCGCLATVCGWVVGFKRDANSCVAWLYVSVSVGGCGAEGDERRRGVSLAMMEVLDLVVSPTLV